MNDLEKFFIRKRIVVILFAFIMITGTVFADEPAIQDLKIGRIEGKIYASYSIEDAFGKEIKERIESGLEVTFNHDLRVVNPNFFWRNEKIAIKKLRTTVKYDSLTKQYNLKKRLNGGIVDSVTTEDFQEVKNWMSNIEKVKLCTLQSLEKETEYSFRVKTKLLDRKFFFFIPYNLNTDWEKINFTSDLNKTFD